MTQAVVRDKMRRLQRLYASGVKPDSQTVGQFLNSWLEESVKPSVHPRTYDSYAQLVRLYIAPRIGKTALVKLAPGKVQTMLNDLVASGLSGRTVQYVRAVLRRALNQAMRWQLVPNNIAMMVQPPKATRPEFPILTPEQLDAFIGSVAEHRLRALYLTSIALGLRQGEAFGLRWPDLDFERSTLSVRYALQNRTFVEPKTRKSRRTLVMPGFVRDALLRHRDEQQQERRIAGSRWQEWNLVFASSIGTPLNSSNVLHEFQRALEAAGLPKLRFHDLRHQCATLLLQKGVHPKVVSEILGHSQISLTLDTYSHVLLTLKAEAAETMEQALGPVATVVATVGKSDRPN